MYDKLKAVFGVPDVVAPAPVAAPAPAPVPVVAQDARDIIPPDVAAKAQGMVWGATPQPAPAPMQNKGQAAAMKKPNGWGQT